MPGRRFLPFCFRPRRLAAMAVLSVALGACAFAQEEPPQEPQPVGGQPESQPEATDPATAPPQQNVTRGVVRGVVKNAATGQPVPRALVRIEGDAASGALTDGDVRFEISGVPVWP